MRIGILGTGLIGGKALGMLIARAILQGSGQPFGDVLEPHDSFYIGSDVFYTFLVTNGVWWARQKQMSPDTFLEAAEGAELEGFLDREVERYRPQLERYARLMGRLYPGEPLEVGLYFPLHRAWRSWVPATVSE